MTQNIIHVHTMTNSQIQQGSPAVSQVQQIDTAALSSLLEDLRDAIPKLHLEDDQATEVAADLATLMAQVASPRPKLQAVRDCLTSLHAIVATAGAAGQLGPEVGELAEKIVHARDSSRFSELAFDQATSLMPCAAGRRP